MADKRVKFTLKFAGENRAELEKVLTHYKDDPEKLEAAKFLIGNMPRYYSYKAVQIDSINRIKAEAAHTQLVHQEDIDEWGRFPISLMPKIYDAHVITSDFLIKNIDLAFQVWQTRPWNKHYSFDDFCEYILPYRIETEPLESWREIFYNRYMPILDSLYQGSDVVEACAVLGEYMRMEGYFYNTEFSYVSSGALFALDHRIGGCRESCDLMVYVARAVGLPVATDFYHTSPETGGSSHLWNVIKDTTGQIVPFWFLDFKAQRGNNDGRKKGKVYRLSFHMQPELYPGITKERQVPSILRNRFLKEVTSEYFGQNQVTVNVAPSNEKQVYLGMFHIPDYVPLDIAEAKHGKATFHNLESNVIYQPLYLKNGQLKPAGHSFFFDKKSVHYFIPDTLQKRSVTITRKFPALQYVINHRKEIVGARIEGSNTPDFAQSDLLYCITDTLNEKINVLEPLRKGKYRYVRFLSAPDKFITLAGLHFCKNMDEEEIIPARVLPLEVFRSVYTLDYINEPDPGYSFKSKEINQKLVYDFGKAVEVGKIVVIPLHDDNFVRAGDDYELFFQNGEKGWTSLGRQKAKSEKLQYENVPKNALLWLHNYTQGVEEEVFWIKDGKQVFLWNLKGLSVKDYTE